MRQTGARHDGQVQGDLAGRPRGQRGGVLSRRVGSGLRRHLGAIRGPAACSRSAAAAAASPSAWAARPRGCAGAGTERRRRGVAAPARWASPSPGEVEVAAIVMAPALRRRAPAPRSSRADAAATTARQHVVASHIPVGDCRLQLAQRREDDSRRRRCARPSARALRGPGTGRNTRTDHRQLCTSRWCRAPTRGRRRTRTVLQRSQVTSIEPCRERDNSLGARHADAVARSRATQG